MARSAFLQVIENERLMEQRNGGSPLPVERGYLARGGPLVKLRDAIGVVLKLLVRLSYLTPVLVIARIIAHFWADPSWGAAIVAGFVTLVLAFFVVLALYVLASFVAWNQSRRARLVRPRAARTRGATNADEQASGTLVTVQGRAVALDQPGAPLVSDFWTERVRVAEASVFALERDAPLGPVVVRMTTAPTVIAHAEETTAGRALAPETYASSELLEHHDGAALAVRAGDTLTITGQLRDRIANVAAFDLDGELYRLEAARSDEATPYRETLARAGLLLSDEPATPLVIEVR